MEMLVKLYTKLSSFISGEKGQTVIEYILVIVLIAIVLVLAFQTSMLQGAIGTAADTIAGYINGSTPAP